MVINSKFVQVLFNLIMIILCLLCIVPLLILIMSSITEERSLIEYGYSLFPHKFSLSAYQYIFKSGNTILRSYGVTILVTLIGTTTNLVMTILFAYALSRKQMLGRNILAFYLFFTMIFNGGLVPTYLMWTQTFHIRDTIWALIVPGLLLGSFNVIMCRTYITTNVPEEIIEAAKIDGASQFRILPMIVVPLSKPIIATIGLMSGLGYWNNWTNGLYYLVRRSDLYPIQSVLNVMIKNADFLKSEASRMGVVVEMDTVPSTGIRMAIACVALLPVMLVYPFIQKAFVRGIVIGGIKG